MKSNGLIRSPRETGSVQIRIVENDSMDHNDSIKMNDADHRFHKHAVEVEPNAVEGYASCPHVHEARHYSAFVHVY